MDSRGLSGLDGTNSAGVNTALVQHPLYMACSDETTALTTGEKISIDIPEPITYKKVVASVNTPPTTAFNVVIGRNGTSIHTLPIGIGVKKVIGGGGNFQENDELTVDVDVDNDATGLKVFFLV
jgi:hypothetical protein